MTLTEPDVRNAVIYFAGELDIASVGRIAAQITAARMPIATAAITADMSQVSFLDASALGAFITGWKECAAVGTVLGMRAPHHCVRRVLDLTGTGALFGVESPTSRPAPRIPPARDAARR